MSRKRTRVQRRRAVAESVAAPARAAVCEAGRATPTSKPGRMLIQLIQAGWSLNGNYYSAEMLKRDGPRAWPAGTQGFIDHQPDEEEEKFPVGSLQLLAAVQTEDARWDEQRRSLVAEVQLFEPWRTPLMQMAEAEQEHGVKAVGLSIRAYATGEHGEAEGRSGMIIDRIEEGRSVDFVTKPAAGGKILAVLEAVQAGRVAEARTIGTWLESRLHLALTQYADDMYGDGRLTRAERITLSSAIGDGLQAWTARVEADAPQLFRRGVWDDAPADGEVEEALTDDTRARLQRAVTVAHGDETEEYPGVWVNDFDPDESIVVFANDGKTWRQAYTDSDGVLELTGEPVEVARRTVYVPLDTDDEAAPAREAVTAPARLPSVEVAEALARADSALKNSPTQSVTASADGSPPTAPNTPSEGVPTMSGTTTEGAPAPGQAGTAVAEEVAVVAAERDQFRVRVEALTTSLTEAQSAQRKAEAERDAALARARLLEGNEAGRTTVDRMLGTPDAGVDEGMYPIVAPRVHDRIRGAVPWTDEGRVDQTALDALVEAAIKAERDYAARLLESQGVGQPAGLGGSGGDSLKTAEQYEDETFEQFRGIGLDEATARIAAKGR